MTSSNGPELEVDAEHDEAGQEEGDAGGGDGVLRTEVQPAGEILTGILRSQTFRKSSKI